MASDSSDRGQFDATLTSGDGPAKRDSGELARGSRISRYTIIDRLGAGGMGVVYGAYDPQLDRMVALKVLHDRDEGSEGNQARTRLLREGQAMAKLNHPNVITVYDAKTVGDRDFFTMEWVDGESLAEWLEQPRSHDEILRAYVDAGKGLAAAHKAGLTHRDFKPANVLIGKDGGVRVTDFGLARADDGAGTEISASVIAAVDTLDTGGDRNLTATGAVIGTPAYMSPEQHTARRADARSDQFSFCVALYEALYGELPFPGKTLGELREAVLCGDVAPEPKSSNVPAPIRKALLTGLSANPSQRHDSMDDLLDALAPEQTSRLGYVMIGVAAAVLGGIALIVFAAQDVEGAPPCRGAGSEIDQIWNADVRRELGAQFGAERGEFFDRFAGQADRYTRDWRATSKRACTAREIEKQTSEQDFLLQQGCLLERKSALDSMLSLIASADDRTIEQSIEIARGLPRVGDCMDLESLRAGILPPETTEVARRVEEIRQRLGGVRVLRDALRYSEAISSAEQALSDARDVDYPPLVAEALLELGIAQGRGKNAVESRKTLREAEIVAEETGYDQLRALALVAQVRVEASFSSDHERALELSRRAAAAIKRLHGDAGLAAELDQYLAQVSADRGDYDDAIARLERSLEALREVGGARSAEVADALTRLASALSRRGRAEEALALFEEALDIRRGIYPRDHPDVILGTEQVAEGLRDAGKIDESNAMYLSVAPFWSSPRGRKTLREIRAGEKLEEPTRPVSGRVVDSAGKPVAGALVMAGRQLLMDGSGLHMRRGGVTESRFQIARTTTSESGEFEVLGHATQSFVVAAEHSGLGRSHTSLIAANHAGPVELALQPFGRLEGRVDSGNEQLIIAVVATETTLPTQHAGGPYALVRDGTFQIERIPQGEFVVHAQLVGLQRGIRVESQTVQIRAGATTTVAFAIEATGTTVAVQVTDETGQPHPGVQVLLIPGVFDAPDVHTFNEKLAGKLDDVQVQTAPPGPIEFLAVRPGKYSVCIVPLPVDPKDPRLAKLEPEKLPVYCRQRPIDGDTQQLTEQVPRTRDVSLD